MLVRQLYHFCLSYKINGKIFFEHVDGINLRHAKDKVIFKYPEATDLMDWTNEKEEDIKDYLKKQAGAISSSATFTK